jgi:hypothetical protein
VVPVRRDAEPLGITKPGCLLGFGQPHLPCVESCGGRDRVLDVWVLQAGKREADHRLAAIARTPVILHSIPAKVSSSARAVAAATRRGSAWTWTSTVPSRAGRTSVTTSNIGPNGVGRHSLAMEVDGLIQVHQVTGQCSHATAYTALSGIASLVAAWGPTAGRPR